MWVVSANAVYSILLFYKCSFILKSYFSLGNLSVVFHSFAGVQILMEMLFEKPSSENLPEVAACERVQQKAAVTLARLSRDPEVAHAAIKLSCKSFNVELSSPV